MQWYHGPVTDLTFTLKLSDNLPVSVPRVPHEPQTVHFFEAVTKEQQ